MSKMTIDIDYDTMDRFVVQGLRNHLGYLEDDLLNRKNDRGMAIFHMDAVKDVMAIEAMIKCFKGVLDWYGDEKGSFPEGK